ncbi:hypothetical protein [Salinisphaera sp. G21_0]|uniref:hypothetical protein n=1 Tax=Salinisphaera sp. G21_0 TaxID=2821094 RepID=UPI001ADAD4D9|nr:hypothetical protein [Salinisphaera sp. G21_0]MBO9482480.1 hypothetical protein [Salinisphaera sp. G21_0]
MVILRCSRHDVPIRSGGATARAIIAAPLPDGVVIDQQHWPWQTVSGYKMC